MRNKILFLCTGNSCRNQMAEGWANELLRGTIEAYSAGTEPHSLNPFAVRVMQEASVDISHHKSKSLESLSGVHFDLIVTVCDNASKSCPIPPTGTKVIHAPFKEFVLNLDALGK